MIKNLNRILIENTLPIIVTLVIVGICSISLFTYWVANYLVRSSMVAGAHVFSQTISEVRNLYTSDVVERVRKHGTEVSPTYKDQEGAIPLPATFTIELANQLNREKQDMKVRLYSDFPYPWRTKEGGPKDQFERDALLQLRKNPASPYYRFESGSDGTVLRYAVADRMRSSCIQCHNSDPQSPKRDWKVGDVRGVIEITRPISPIAAAAREGVILGTVLIFVLSALGLLGITVVVKALKKHSETLSSAVVARDDFINMAAHDLKSPLTAILLNIQMHREMAMEDRPIYKDADEVQRIFLKLERQIKKFASSVDNLLDVTRISAGGLKLNKTKVNLNDCIKSVVDQYEDDAARSGCEVNLDLGKVDSGNWDAFRVTQIVSNLLSNAIKFGNGKSIEIRTVQFDDKVTLTITDHGEGIDPHDQKIIFEKFARVSRTSKSPGLGLGLFIVHKIVLAHNGTIDVESEIGNGTTFKVTLPR